MQALDFLPTTSSKLWAALAQLFGITASVSQIGRGHTPTVRNDLCCCLFRPRIYGIFSPQEEIGARTSAASRGRAEVRDGVTHEGNPFCLDMAPVRWWAGVELCFDASIVSA